MKRITVDKSSTASRSLILFENASSAIVMAEHVVNFLSALQIGPVDMLAYSVMWQVRSTCRTVACSPIDPEHKCRSPVCSLQP